MNRNRGREKESDRVRGVNRAIQSLWYLGHDRRASGPYCIGYRGPEDETRGSIPSNLSLVIHRVMIRS